MTSATDCVSSFQTTLAILSSSRFSPARSNLLLSSTEPKSTGAAVRMLGSLRRREEEALAPPLARHRKPGTGAPLRDSPSAQLPMRLKTAFTDSHHPCHGGLPPPRWSSPRRRRPSALPLAPHPRHHPSTPNDPLFTRRPRAAARLAHRPDLVGPLPQTAIVILKRLAVLLLLLSRWKAPAYHFATGFTGSSSTTTKMGR